MALRTRLSLTWLETRDVPDGGYDPPSSPPPPQFSAMIVDPGLANSINPGQGPIGGGETYGAPTPPGSP